MAYDRFREKLEQLGKQEGSETLAHLIDLVVTQREALSPSSALSAAERMDWDRAWDETAGPALDKLELILRQHGATG